jgi:hypothetical protein
VTETSNAVINFPRDSEDPLLAALRQGARKLLLQALEQEVEDYVAMFAALRDDDGKRLAVSHAKRGLHKFLGAAIAESDFENVPG